MLCFEHGYARRGLLEGAAGLLQGLLHFSAHGSVVLQAHTRLRQGCAAAVGSEEGKEIMVSMVGRG